MNTFRERTDTEFPEVFKRPILIQMSPTSWKKEFQTNFRQPGADRKYEALIGQLLAIGNEEWYISRRGGPDDMDTDNLEKIAALHSGKASFDSYYDDPRPDHDQDV